MAENMNSESLLAQIQQLEHERDELRKDIEQLCMQQAGPGYLAVVTRMHFQRTAGLEQEIESLKKKLATCTRDNLNLQEELSEAYRIKSQLADLHSAEVAKNMEAEKQVKFFHGCVAAAFAERDHAIMEAEKAKEKEESMSQLMNPIQKRVEELTSECIILKKLNDDLQIDMAKLAEQNETFKMVINKFFEIRQQSLKEFEDTSWDDKCEFLLHDPDEVWSFNDTSTSKYISTLEDELERVRNSVDSLQNKLRVGLEIENHLKKKINVLEKKQMSFNIMINNSISDLKCYYSQYRDHIKHLLNDGESSIKSIISMIDERVRKFDQSGNLNLIPQNEAEAEPEDHECRDVHISPQAIPVSENESNEPSVLNIEHGGKGGASEALSQALQEKVAALLLLSQQEERHLLERNVHLALQKKVEELQRNLLQVTNEKVKALMELAQIKQENHLLREKFGPQTKEEKSVVDSGERNLVVHQQDGRLRNLLKKTYLKRWINPLDASRNEADRETNSEGKFFHRRSSSMDLARMKIEVATLKESLESMDHLTSSFHRLRLSLLKAKDSLTSEGTKSGAYQVLDSVINEAKLLRTALGSSLPISWSAGEDVGVSGDSTCSDLGYINQDCGDEKVDTVSAAGFEMMELVIFAAQKLKDAAMHSNVVPDIEAA
ncbi:centriolin isoform X1 [Neltuma alba]|uniref:centriolin isoform X1 n=1 Tax=Neltuma alba TaxID=207710 RepID=UPI0010A36B54|nr:centriolin-like isoform X1 [Prosopis alba]